MAIKVTVEETDEPINEHNRFNKRGACFESDAEFVPWTDLVEQFLYSLTGLGYIINVPSIMEAVEVRKEIECREGLDKLMKVKAPWERREDEPT